MPPDVHREVDKTDGYMVVFPSLHYYHPLISPWDHSRNLFAHLSEVHMHIFHCTFILTNTTLAAESGVCMVLVWLFVALVCFYDDYVELEQKG